MNFQVPQFIEIEDKIFGPLTFKQFIYVAGGAGAAFILWTYLPRVIAVIPALAVLGLGLALAFYKINNRPFIFTLESALRYFVGRKLYLWQRKDKTPEARQLPTGQNRSGIAVSAPKLSQSRLKELSWSLDVQEKVK